MRPAAPRRYEIFDPNLGSVAEQGAVTFLVYLPEFRKEELRIQLSSSRLLRISGERPLGGDKWKRFVKEIRVPEDCDAKGMVAKFDRGVLYVKQPKLVIPEKIDRSKIPEKMEEEKQPKLVIPEKIDRSKIPEKMEEEKEQRKEDQRKCVDEHGMESGDAENDDLRKKNEQEIHPDEQGQFEKNKINTRKLLLILVLVVALVLRIMYSGRVL